MRVAGARREQQDPAALGAVRLDPRPVGDRPDRQPGAVERGADAVDAGRARQRAVAVPDEQVGRVDAVGLVAEGVDGERLDRGAERGRARADRRRQRPGSGEHDPHAVQDAGAQQLHRAQRGMTQPAIATKWTIAAAMTSVWKTSWKPNTRGHGFGRCQA